MAFDCDSYARGRFRATNSKSWRSGNYRYTKTDYYTVARDADIGFKRIPIDGSTKVDNKYSEAIEPYVYDDMRPFTRDYLTGFLTDKYDVQSNQCIPRVNQRIKESAETELKKTIKGYDSVNLQSMNMDVDHGDIRYALLPMWILTSKYNNKKYTFAMNGQTGKFVGELPLSKLKFTAAFAASFVVATGIAAVVLSLFS